MKKLLLSVSGSIAVLLVPALAYAAFNDVSLSTDVDLSVNSITLDVYGSSGTVESITVDSTSFTAVLQAGSFLHVSAPDRNQLSYDVLYAGSSFGGANSTCNSASSTLAVTATASTTLTVTPTSTICTTATSTASSGGSSRSDERSSGATTSIVVPVPAVAVVQAGVVTTSNPSRVILTANLSTGSRGSQVKGLQQFLNTHGFVIATSGPGSPGKETTTFGSLTRQALEKFQKQHGIVSSGTPSTTGYGRVGPKTRAKINALSAQ